MAVTPNAVKRLASSDEILRFAQNDNGENGNGK
jgi:hypothetical protein